jgi:serine/threonine protein kinase
MTTKPQQKAPTELVGKVVSGKYRLKKLIATDHLGALYDAEEIKARKQLVVKALAPGVRLGVWDATGLMHPNIVKIRQFLDLGGGKQFVIADHPAGSSLAALLKQRRKLKPGEAVSIVMQVLAGLHSLHGSGLVHGAVSPETIFVSHDEEEHLEVQVLFLGSISSCEPPELPLYFSPEQDLGEVEIDQRSDIWTVGVLLFEMIYGRRPFAGRNRDEISSKILLKPPIFPEGGAIPEDLPPIIEKALEKEADDRYQNVTQMLGDLLPVHEELDEEFGRTSEEAIRDSLIPPPAPPEPGGQKEELEVFEHPFPGEGPPSVKPIRFEAPAADQKKKEKPPQKPAAKPKRSAKATQELRVFAPPVPAAKPEAKTEPKPAAKVEPKPAAKVEPKPAAKVEPKPAAKVEPKPAAKLAPSRPKPKPRAKTAPLGVPIVAKPAPKAKAESPPKSRPKAESPPNPPAKAAPAEPAPVAKPVTTRPKPKPKKGVEPKSKEPTVKAVPLQGDAGPAEEVAPEIAVDVAPPPLPFDSQPQADGPLLQGLEADSATTLPLKSERSGFGGWVSRNRKPVIIVGSSVAAVCLLIVLLVAVLGGQDEPESGAGRPDVVADLSGAGATEKGPADLESEPAPEPQPEPAAGSASGAQTGADEDGEEAAEEEPEEVTVELKGLPDGAEVTAGGEGVEPAFKLAKSDSPVAIAVRAEGYEPYDTQVVPDRDHEVVVTMSEIAAPEEEAAAPEVAGGGRPAAGSAAGQASWGGASLPSAAPETESEPEKPKKKKNVWATNPF